MMETVCARDLSGLGWKGGVIVMRFDRETPGEGVQVSGSLENGKLYQEWSFRIEGKAVRISEGESRVQFAEQSRGKEHSEVSIHLRLTDKSGMVALECRQLLAEEEPLRTVLLQPRLWNSTRDPYLYQMEVFLLNGQGVCVDRISRQIPLRVLESRKSMGPETEEVFLNGERFSARAVRYALSEAGTCALPEAGKHALPEKAAAAFEAKESPEPDRHRLREDLRQMVNLGANCICLERAEEPTGLFLQLCQSMGLLVCGQHSKIKIQNVDKVPWFQGRESNPFSDGGCLFSAETGSPTSTYYKYKAKWSPEPFVYIVPESVRKLKSGNYSVTCYSNCNRVALYSDGILFEFQKGEEEFTFWEVPAKSPCIMLAAEGEGCYQSFSVHKNFTK